MDDTPADLLTGMEGVDFLRVGSEAELANALPGAMVMPGQFLV